MNAHQRRIRRRAAFGYPVVRAIKGYLRKLRAGEITMDPMPIFPIPPVPGHAIPLMVFDWMDADPAFAADVRMAVAPREARLRFTLPDGAVPRMDPHMERMVQDEYTEHLRRTLSK